MKKSDWISVKDRLPTREDAEPHGRVLALEIIGSDAYYATPIWRLVARNSRYTHWMPLPPLPEEE